MIPTDEEMKARYNQHRAVATQIATLYVEVNKLTAKKPVERLTPLVAQKINHVIRRVKDHIRSDEFLDAIESLPTEGEFSRYDEALILLAELRSAMRREWGSNAFLRYRRTLGIDPMSGLLVDEETF